MTDINKTNFVNTEEILSKIDVICFDFDGVLTNNLVHLNENGLESVSCSRSDGLAFDGFKKLNLPVYIVSTEKNPVVQARAKKINVPLVQGAYDKVEAVSEIVNKKNYDFSRVFYVGNDLNDFKIMKLCGFSACPLDSHVLIKEIANFKLNTNGGEGVAREIIEDIFKVDLIKLLFE